MISALKTVSVSNKEQLALNFSKAARQYDENAHVQKAVSRYAMSLMPSLCDDKVECLLDLGCGTSAIWTELCEYTKQLIGLDISQSMLQQARYNLANQQTSIKTAFNSDSQYAFCNADAESLPFKDNSVQFIYSSMALQWCYSIEKVFAECYRVLTPGSSALLGVLSGESFESLTSAYKRIGRVSRLNSFLPSQSIIEAASALPWNCDTETHTFTTYHDSVIDMLRSIKQIGADTPNVRQTIPNQSLLQYSHARKTSSIKSIPSADEQYESDKMNSKSELGVNDKTYLSRQELQALQQSMVENMRSSSKETMKTSALTSEREQSTNNNLPLEYSVVFLKLRKS